LQYWAQALAASAAGVGSGGGIIGVFHDYTQIAAGCALTSRLYQGTYFYVPLTVVQKLIWQSYMIVRSA